MKDDEILQNILLTLKRIEERLDKIENIVNINTKSAQKMDKHIDFIDNIYSYVKVPFCNLLSRYSNIGIINIDKKLLSEK